MIDRRFKSGPARWLAIPIALACASLHAEDVFLLHNGGRIHGQWENPQKAPGEPYVIHLPEGGSMSLEPSQVRQTVAGEPWKDEYRQVASAAEDSVSGQWAVAEWCRQHELEELRQIHLRKILEVDPDHADARHALGYSQVRGRWVTRGQQMAARGYQRHEGRWRLPQDVQLIEERKKLDQAEKDWLATLRRWRAMMASENAPEAYRNVAGLKDPLAIPALRELLCEERYRHIKLLYVQALGRIGNRASAEVLVQLSLSDPDEEIFHAALAELTRNRPPHIASSYVTSLKDNNNIRLNRAGYALGRLGDRSCISPLIDALVTTHYMVLPSDPNTHTATFLRPTAAGGGGPLGGTGFSSGQPPQVIPWTVRNDAVLQSLILLSGGVNFGFDQRAWNAWLANENRTSLPDFDSRRERD